ncbi:MAG TPA: TonB-dependent receptor, partial [Bryobacteraceae bacterium]
RTQLEIDMIRLSGPAFEGVDNRLMSLLLVEQGLTDATMFTAEGEVVQPSEAISGKALLMERGAFRPVTNVTWEMLQGAQRQFCSTRHTKAVPLVLMEMTLSNLVTEHRIDHGDFLARASMLNALGITVMVSNYDRFDLVTSYLRRYTKEAIVMVMGAPTLLNIFEEKYYQRLPGGMLEGLGRLFQGDTTLYVYPMKAAPDAPVVDAVSLPLAPLSRRLYWYLLESGQIQPVREFREEQLHVYPDDVLAKIEAGDPAWESMVPPEVAELIRARGLFGFKA